GPYASKPRDARSKSATSLLQGRVVRPDEEDALDLDRDGAVLLGVGFHLDPLGIAAEGVPRRLGRCPALVDQHVDELLPGAGLFVERLPESDDLQPVFLEERKRVISKARVQRVELPGR